MILRALLQEQAPVVVVNDNTGRITIKKDINQIIKLVILVRVQMRLVPHKVPIEFVVRVNAFNNFAKNKIYYCNRRKN